MKKDVIPKIIVAVGVLILAYLWGYVHGEGHIPQCNNSAQVLCLTKGQ